VPSLVPSVPSAPLADSLPADVDDTNASVDPEHTPSEVPPDEPSPLLSLVPASSPAQAGVRRATQPNAAKRALGILA